VSASDAPNIEAITSRRWNGLLASELHQQTVLKALLAVRATKAGLEWERRWHGRPDWQGRSYNAGVVQEIISRLQP
jgi:hypothetical protein